MDKVKIGSGFTDPGLAQKRIPKQGPNIQAEFGNSTF